MCLIAKGNAQQVSHPWSLGLVDYELYREGEELELYVRAGEPDPRTRVRGITSGRPIALVPIIERIGQWSRDEEHWGTYLKEFLPGSDVDCAFVVAALRDLRVLKETGPNPETNRQGMPSRVHPDFRSAEWWLQRMMEAPALPEEEVTPEEIDV